MRGRGFWVVAACTAAVACGGDEFSEDLFGTGGTGGASGGNGGASGGSSGTSGGSGAGGASGGNGGASGGASGTGASGGTSGSGGASGGAGGASGGSGGASGGSGGASGGSGGASGGSGGASGGSGGASGGSGGASGGSGGASGGSGGTGGTGGGPACTVQGAKPAPVGGEEVLAITADIQPEYPVVSGGYVYWTTNLGLWRVDLAGTCLQSLATVSAPSQLEGIAVSNGFVYVANAGGGTVFRVPVTGGTPQTLATGQTNVQTVAVDATHTYFTVPGLGVARVLNAGGGFGVISTASGPNQGFAIAVDSNFVFVATRQPRLYRMPKTTPGAPTQIDQGVGATVNTADPVYIALFANRVYWTHWLNAPDSGAVRSVTTDGQNPVVISAAHPEGIALDANWAYWALGYSPGGTIWKGYSALTTASTLVAGQERPRGVAIDATHVYWTNFADRTVRRMLR